MAVNPEGGDSGKALPERVPGYVCVYLCGICVSITFLPEM